MQRGINKEPSSSAQLLQQDKTVIMQERKSDLRTDNTLTLTVGLGIYTPNMHA